MNLLSSRTIMEEQRDQLSDIPHFFPTRKMVARYNEMILQNTMEHKITITAIASHPMTLFQSLGNSYMLQLTKGRKYR